MQARQLANPKTRKTHSLSGEVSRTSSPMPRVKDHVKSLAVVERSGPSPGEGHKHVKDSDRDTRN